MVVENNNAYYLKTDPPTVTWVLVIDLTGYGLYCDEVFIEEFESTISDLVTVQIIFEIIAL